MTTHPSPGSATEPVQHTDVAAYALGVLDAADAERYEEHLAGCDRCAVELKSMTALTPFLAEHARDGGPPVPERPRAERPERPRAALLEQLLTDTAGEAAAERRRRDTRRLWLAAGVFALVVVGGLLAVLAMLGDDGDAEQAASPARQMYERGEKTATVDVGTETRATVSLEKKSWGTHVALQLGHISGPESCELVAVGKDGTEQTVTTWAVPAHGYGIADTRWHKPLYTDGGAAFARSELDRFEVRTLSGRHLATIDIRAR
ncbi:anti-sigma factor family protein [Streptomyces axinellae]|uniref:Anti-sigma U factor RsuA n=1 Tax=Streptomyces axinellae TaxID=552788 RepID=A0ABN3QI36_9ACTN